MDCLACRLASDQEPLPGGTILATPSWRVEHCIGPLGVGTLIVKPRRHVLELAELDEEEAAELGPLLRRVSAVVKQLTGCQQVYCCLWAHGPVHLHFVVQPIGPDLVGRVGPALQAAMFEAGDLPPRMAVEEFSARARKALDG
jgi:diadenosine tetraphosphate (Ap4A) HIT family hydrolase